MAAFNLLITKKISPSLLQKAADAGIRVTEKEFISIIPDRRRETYQAVKALLGEKISAVFSSSNAVSYVASVISEPGEAGPGKAEPGEIINDVPSTGIVETVPKQVNVDWKIYAIEGKTSTLAGSVFGSENIVGVAENGADLAELIIKQRHPSDRPMSFFCGDKRRDELPKKLSGEGIALHEVQVYSTNPTPVRVDKSYDAVAFFSPSAAESFFSVNRLPRHTVCFSVGNTTRAAIENHTGNTVVTIKSASEEEMMATVIKYVKKINAEN